MRIGADQERSDQGLKNGEERTEIACPVNQRPGGDIIQAIQNDVNYRESDSVLQRERSERDGGVLEGALPCAGR